MDSADANDGIYHIFRLRVEKDRINIGGVFECSGIPENGTLGLECDAKLKNVISKPGGFLNPSKSDLPHASTCRFWDFSVPLIGITPFDISFRISGSGKALSPCTIKFQNEAPLTERTDTSFLLENGWLIRYAFSSHLRVRPASLLSGVVAELRFDFWLLFRQSSRRAKVCVPIRWIVRLLRPILLRKRIWLMMDRMGSAGDNAEALFQYLVENQSRIGCRPVFALRKDSPHWSRLKSIGPVFSYSPFRFRMMAMFAEWTLASQAIRGVEFRPFGTCHLGYKGIANNAHFAFLQHGVTQNDLSSHLNRKTLDLDLLVTVSSFERDAFLSNPAYGYDKSTVVLTGFPRFDYFKNHPKKIITFLPTWRRPLCNRYDAQSDTAILSENFLESPYFRHLKDVVAAPKLLQTANALGYEINFLPHPQFQHCRDLFAFSDRVKLLPVGYSYAEIYEHSLICVTDYSSAVFDFAWLGKPVVYYQPDDDLHYQRGYYDYEKCGLGDITHYAEELITRLIDLMERGCPIDEPYKTRINDFFAFRDKNNCFRVTNAILAASDANMASNSGSGNIADLKCPLL